MPSSLDKLGELCSWENFEESKVPPKNAFYSKMNMKGINDNDYENAQQVWNRTTPEAGDVALRDYHDAYLATDLLTCLEHSKLEPGYFYTAPGFAWQALLKTAAENCEHKANRKDCKLCIDEFRLELLIDILKHAADVWKKVSWVSCTKSITSCHFFNWENKKLEK